VVSSDEINKMLKAKREGKINVIPYKPSVSRGKNKTTLVLVFLWLLGISQILNGLLGNDAFRIMYLFMGAFIIVIALFHYIGYVNKTFFLILAVIWFLSCLFLFKYIINTGFLFDTNSIFMAAFCAVMGITTIILYKIRERDPNIHWNDEWGF